MGEMADEHAMRLYDLGDEEYDRVEEPITFPGELQHETQKAYLVNVGGEIQVWLPKSQTTKVKRPNETEWDYDFTVPAWLAMEKGLDKYAEG